MWGVKTGRPCKALSSSLPSGEDGSPPGELFPPSLDVWLKMAQLGVLGTLVLPQPTGGLICWTEGGLPGSPQPRLHIRSGEPGDTILVPDLIACDICITPRPAVPPGPTGLAPLPSSPSPTAQGGGAHVESLSPCSPLPSQ